MGIFEMKTFKQIIDSISPEEMRLFISQYEQFERDGFIGTCELRSRAMSCPEGNQHVTMWMGLIAFECYRHFTNEYFEMVKIQYE